MLCQDAMIGASGHVANYNNLHHSPPGRFSMQSWWSSFHSASFAWREQQKTSNNIIIIREESRAIFLNMIHIRSPREKWIQPSWWKNLFDPPSIHPFLSSSGEDAETHDSGRIVFCKWIMVIGSGSWARMIAVSWSYSIVSINVCSLKMRRWISVSFHLRTIFQDETQFHDCKWQNYRMEQRIVKSSAMERVTWSENK